MHSRIIRITAAFLLTLLIAGCAKMSDPTPEQKISFGAGSLLLNNDAETKGDIKEGTDFSEGDAFTVYGSHHTSESESMVFDGETVTKGSSGWTYDNPRSWSWVSTSDWYDFEAVYPAGKGTSRMNISGNLSLSTRYDITEGDNYDLMAAALRRKGNVLNPTAIVEMEFSHMTSAVGVVIINNSAENSVTINSYEFKNLMVCGDMKVTLDNVGEPLTSWINTERNSSSVMQSSPSETVLPGERYTGGFDMMIPQRLDQAVGSGSLEENMPALLITYTPEGGVQKTAVISLKGIQRQDGTPITSWETGVKYTYYVTMRLDGGLLVKITTTGWDTVEAETPGLVID